MAIAEDVNTIIRTNITNKGLHVFFTYVHIHIELTSPSQEVRTGGRQNRQPRWISLNLPGKYDKFVPAVFCHCGLIVALHGGFIFTVTQGEKPVRFYPESF
jgi:hypothetical protein